MKYFSTKTYGHERGLSCVFRQPNATHSHCSLLHGYSLAFSFKFGAEGLDNKNWVVDFGGLQDLKQWLEDNFDHTLVVSRDDPAIDALKELEAKGLAKVVVLSGVGCEKFAEEAFWYADYVAKQITGGRAYCVSCEVREHGSNSAIYEIN